MFCLENFLSHTASRRTAFTSHSSIVTCRAEQLSENGIDRSDNRPDIYCHGQNGMYVMITSLYFSYGMSVFKWKLRHTAHKVRTHIVCVAMLILMIRMYLSSFHSFAASNTPATNTEKPQNHQHILGGGFSRGIFGVCKKRSYEYT